MNSIVSYPKRGPWGDAKFRGNFTGYLVKDLIEFTNPTIVADPTRGGGTTLDVCQELNIRCWSEDINTGFNILTDDLPIAPDLMIAHYPYHQIIKYGQKDGELSAIHRYEHFLDATNEASYRLFSQIRQGGYFAMVVGMTRKSGVYRDMAKDLSWFGKTVATIIKMQHNTYSGRKYYGGHFIPIVHETIVLTSRPEITSFMIRGSVIGKHKLQESNNITWRALVFAAMSTLKQGTNQEIYQECEKYLKCKDARFRGVDYKATIRRELQQREDFTNVREGEWAYA